jgi:hypothetical protein
MGETGSSSCLLPHHDCPTTLKKGPPHPGGPICASLIDSGNRRQRQLSAWVPAAAHCHKHTEGSVCRHAVTLILFSVHYTRRMQRVKDKIERGTILLFVKSDVM